MDKMKIMSSEQTIILLDRLVEIARSRFPKSRFKTHQEGRDFTRLMITFFIQHCEIADLIKTLYQLNRENFPISLCYTIIRNMFELHIIAHYIAQEPRKRSDLYIQYDSVIQYEKMMGLNEFKSKNNTPYKEMAVKLLSEMDIENITDNYEAVKQNYTNNNGRSFLSWTGKNIKKLAEETNHLYEYKLYYKPLCNFTHQNIESSFRYMNFINDELIISNRSNEYDIAQIFNLTSIFFACFLDLMGKTFDIDLESELKNCWNF